MSPRISESELIVPALYIMTLNEHNGGEILTSVLIDELEKIMKPKGIDAQLLEGRNDSYFSQKVRNLKSHSTLSRKGYAIEIENGFRITDAGRELVRTNEDFIQYLLQGEFAIEDILQSCSSPLIEPKRRIITYEEIISEGKTVTKTSKARERSAKLRDIAIEHFTHNGIIECDCCGFIFSDNYPDIYKSNCIEIHHIKPIFQYDGDSEMKTIEDALNNLLPVCPNCHRVIHKNHIHSKNIHVFTNAVRDFRAAL